MKNYAANEHKKKKRKIQIIDLKHGVFMSLSAISDTCTTGFIESGYANPVEEITSANLEEKLIDVYYHKQKLNSVVKEWIYEYCVENHGRVHEFSKLRCAYNDNPDMVTVRWIDTGCDYPKFLMLKQKNGMLYGTASGWCALQIGNAGRWFPCYREGQGRGISVTFEFEFDGEEIKIINHGLTRLP